MNILKLIFQQNGVSFLVEIDKAELTLLLDDINKNNTPSEQLNMTSDKVQPIKRPRGRPRKNG